MKNAANKLFVGFARILAHDAIRSSLISLATSALCFVVSALCLVTFLRAIPRVLTKEPVKPPPNSPHEQSM